MTLLGADSGWLGGGSVVRQPSLSTSDPRPLTLLGADAGWLGGGSVVRQPSLSTSDPRRRDVFLGGSCGSSRWRDEVAVPILLFVVYAVILPSVSYAVSVLHI